MFLIQTKIQNIKNKIKSHKTLLSNFGYLSVLQFVNILTPLIILPFLIRILEPEIYGLIIYATSINAVFAMIVNFGFNIYAVKLVSQYRDYSEKLSSIVSIVYTIKFILFLICIMLLITSVFVIGKGEYLWLFILTMYLSITELLLPTWFFQGIEKMKHITILNFISKITFVILILIFVSDKKDYLLVPSFQLIGICLTGIMSIYILRNKYNIVFSIPKFRKLFYHTKKASPFFISRFSSVINSRVNSIIIGNSLGLSEVSYYDLAIKISDVAKVIFGIINQAIYPKVVKDENINFVYKIIKICFIIALFEYLIIFITQDLIIKILGGEMMIKTKDILMIVCITIPIVSISYFLGNCILVVKGFTSIFNKSVLYSSILYVFLLSILYFSNNVTIINLSILYVIIELFVLLHRYLHIKIKI